MSGFDKLNRENTELANYKEEIKEDEELEEAPLTEDSNIT